MPGSRTNCTTIYLFFQGRSGNADYVRTSCTKRSSTSPYPSRSSAAPLPRRAARWSPALSSRPALPLLSSSFFLSSLYFLILCCFCGSDSSKLRRSMRKSPMSSLETGMKKKKRCGFIMLVVESAAAGCGIPSCDSLRKNLSKLHNANNAEINQLDPACRGDAFRREKVRGP